MELKPGYKLTEAGVIPEEWDAAPLKGRIEIAHGFPFEGQHFVAHGTYRLATPGHFYEDGGFRDIGEKQKYYDGPVPTGYVLRLGDLIVAMTEQADGLLGSAALIPQADSYLHNQRLGRVKVGIPQINVQFLYYIFNASHFRSKVRETAAGTKVKHTSPQKLLDIAVPLPPPAEQRAIAGALSDVDALIGALDQLLAKKRDLKQAAMQQLLTGHQRLPGFADEWRECQLSELGVFSKGKGIKKDERVSNGKPCVRYGEIYTHHNDCVREFYSFIPDAVARESQRLRFGDLLFAGSGETAEDIGKCVAFLIDVEAYAGGDIVIFTPHEQDSMYLGYLMNHTTIAAQKARMGQGDAVVHISATNLGRIRLRVPPRAEQTAITEVLSDKDAELAALEQKRDKTRLLKQGMMQELLTGRTRLI